MRGPDHRTSSNQFPCRNCGTLGSNHDREKVFPDSGPAGTYHYRYLCPDGGGRYQP